MPDREPEWTVAEFFEEQREEALPRLESLSLGKCYGPGRPARASSIVQFLKEALDSPWAVNGDGPGATLHCQQLLIGVVIISSSTLFCHTLRKAHVLRTRQTAKAFVNFLHASRNESTFTAMENRRSGTANSGQDGK